MAFDAGYADKINNALEEYRQDESEMRQNAPGAENFNTEAEGTKKPEIKKEPVDGSVEITFDPDGMTANMILHKAYNGGRPVTAAIVMAELLKKGINTGIDDLDIKDMVDGGVYETPICVARAIPPKRGENGSISFRYEKKRVPKPQHDEFGVADFRELNLIVPIHKGDIIADIKQPTPGEPGVNIFGRAIMPEPGKMPNITVGKNTLMTADGKYIVSACDGHIMYGTGCFNVEDTVTVKSDLDISVGNIDFFGDIYIKGNVMEGFSVKAGRSLKIEGTVFSADLAAGGDITINGGAINSRIKSTITCMKDVTAGVIGSEKYTATEINIGDGSVTCARKRAAEDELKTVVDIYEQASKNVDFLKMRKKCQGGRLTDVQSKQMKTETQNKVFYSVKRKELEEYIAQLEADLKHRDDLCAKVTGTIFPGSKFCINYLTLDATEVYNRSKVCVINDTIQIVPM